jgi:hypothetical protein
MRPLSASQRDQAQAGAGFGQEAVEEAGRYCILLSGVFTSTVS